MRPYAVALLGISLLALGCNEPSAPAPQAPGTEASVPQFTRSAPAAQAGEEAATANAEPPSSATAEAAPSASATAGAEDLPDVDVKTIGMHIGGGPNDKATKTPIRTAVEGNTDAFRACFGLVTAPGKGGTFGVDIRIPGGGGPAKIRDPRSGLDGPGVQDCMVKAFEGVEFTRPPRGVPMVVSYSLRFTPR